MDQVVKALKTEEIEAIQAKQANVELKAKQVLPAGFQSEKSIDLTIPVEFDGVVYSSISIRRLKGSDFARLKNAGADADAGLLSLIVSCPSPVLGEMDADDYLRLAEEARDFLPRSLRGEEEPTSADGRSSQQ
ncbi:hypothetical protein PDO_2972 [Rhizobium sp. PDO1-076]|uniref:phage tail assembly protein n=1 Tax=Rhizobium sp. PDO1-076 TaxID=1125979 RepID=UPI00024E2D8F|nr:phage tail assembly protein [Rhizobium sp. PDO1-076]EHS49765.1 hypothetical protein PDO_2972 [Rhizobium sp. PDO1-076]